jgi:hypothetical protein
MTIAAGSDYFNAKAPGVNSVREDKQAGWYCNFKKSA